MFDNGTIAAAREALAPTGTLRAAINLGNFLLVSGRDTEGGPFGVAPDFAAEIATRLGVAIHYVCYDMPAQLAAAVDDNAWDIGLIGAEPARAKSIAFTPAYAEIECTYLVSGESSLASIGDVDRAGVRIASVKGAAYDLWLEANLRHATLIQAKTLDASFDAFVAEGLDALAGLRPRLLTDARKLSDARILEGGFSSVQQAVGTQRANSIGAQFLESVVQDAKRSGLIARLIDKHRVQGLSVARD